jgi:hypothetical protein
MISGAQRRVVLVVGTGPSPRVGARASGLRVAGLLVGAVAVVRSCTNHGEARGCPAPRQGRSRCQWKPGQTVDEGTHRAHGVFGCPSAASLVATCGRVRAGVCGARAITHADHACCGLFSRRPGSPGSRHDDEAGIAEEPGETSGREGTALSGRLDGGPARWPVAGRRRAASPGGRAGAPRGRLGPDARMTQSGPAARRSRAAGGRSVKKTVRCVRVRT